ncbi:MSC_0622 family F1-like ATPase gamma subunit [Metamycoplasma buccale]|uniref:MSC_0622 family F1-like ATPase gamma subunit n=1 Tax=Metamycoplasma buccale TaxID=55602 RepID=UPI00398E4B1B
MHLDKLIQKQRNLENIYLKVNNDKNILLIDIMKLNKKMFFYVNNAILNKNLINGLKYEYDVRNPLIHEKTKISENVFFKKIKNFFVKERQLWIYLTEEQKYSTDSYSRYEKYILKNISKVKADFITIGTRALKFCQDNNLNILKSFTENDKKNNLAAKLTQIIKILYTDDNYSSAYFVINSNKNFEGAFNILPIKNFNVHKLLGIDENNSTKNIKNFKIYPSIEDFVDTEINIFLENAIHSLIIESSFYSAKTALVTTNKIIKDLDESLLKLNKKITHIKREKEVEELMLITRKDSFLNFDNNKVTKTVRSQEDKMLEVANE